MRALHFGIKSDYFSCYSIYFRVEYLVREFIHPKVPFSLHYLFQGKRFTLSVTSIVSTIRSYRIIGENSVCVCGEGSKSGLNELESKIMI